MGYSHPGFSLARIRTLPSGEPSWGLGQGQHFHFPESAHMATPAREAARKGGRKRKKRAVVSELSSVLGKQDYSLSISCCYYDCDHSPTPSSAAPSCSTFSWEMGKRKRRSQSRWAKGPGPLLSLPCLLPPAHGARLALGAHRVRSRCLRCHCSPWGSGQVS